MRESNWGQRIEQVALPSRWACRYLLSPSPCSLSRFAPPLLYIIAFWVFEIPPSSDCNKSEFSDLPSQHRGPSPRDYRHASGGQGMLRDMSTGSTWDHIPERHPTWAVTYRYVHSLLLPFGASLRAHRFPPPRPPCSSSGLLVPAPCPFLWPHNNSRPAHALRGRNRNTFPAMSTTLPYRSIPFPSLPCLSHPAPCLPCPCLPSLGLPSPGPPSPCPQWGLRGLPGPGRLRRQGRRQGLASINPPPFCPYLPPLGTLGPISSSTMSVGALLPSEADLSIPTPTLPNPPPQPFPITLLHLPLLAPHTPFNGLHIWVLHIGPKCFHQLTCSPIPGLQISAHLERLLHNHTSGFPIYGHPPQTPFNPIHFFLCLWHGVQPIQHFFHCHFFGLGSQWNENGQLPWGCKIPVCPSFITQELYDVLDYILGQLVAFGLLEYPGPPTH